MSRPPEKTVVHEYCNKDSAHRLAIVDASGKRTESDWARYDEFVYHRGFYATTAYWEGRLPVGVFRLNPIPHEVVDVKEAPP